MRCKILLVDDDPHLLEGLKRVLHKEPYDILSAESAEDALRILQAEPIEVVISDQDMPAMTGTELLGKIREKYPQTIRFMLTGKPTLEVAIEAINNGAISRFFTKPCNHVDLAVSIRQALEQKELMSHATRLLGLSQRQSSMIERLEKEYPGISKVNKDAEGSVVLETSPGDYRGLMKAIKRQLGAEDE
jgi:two-component system, probable response regulator PhcQ